MRLALVSTVLVACTPTALSIGEPHRDSTTGDMASTSVTGEASEVSGSPATTSADGSEVGEVGEASGESGSTTNAGESSSTSTSGLAESGDESASNEVTSTGSGGQSTG